MDIYRGVIMNDNERKLLNALRCILEHYTFGEFIKIDSMNVPLILNLLNEWLQSGELKHL